VKCVLVASGVSTGEAWSMASRIWAGPRLPSPQIQKGWLFPCYSCTVRPTGVLLLLLLQHQCINYSKFPLNFAQ